MTNEGVTFSEYAPSRPSSSRQPAAAAILVAGMHRSGTSALAGLLEALGAQRPLDFMDGDEHNERGYFESHSIVGFHDSLLRAAGSSWHDITADLTLSPHARDAAASELAALLRSVFGDPSLIAVKDPRMCRFIDVDIQALRQLDREICVLLPLRHPMEIAGSLATRDKMSSAHAVGLWLGHVLPAERGTRGLKRSFIVFDELLTDWRQSVDKITSELKVSWPRSPDSAAKDVSSFLTADLKHHWTAERHLPHELGELGAIAETVWSACLDLRRDAYDVNAMRRMDSAAAGLEKINRFAVAYVDAERTRSAHLEAQKQGDERLSEAHKRLHQREQELDDALRRITQMEGAAEQALLSDDREVNKLKGLLALSRRDYLDLLRLYRQEKEHSQFLRDSIETVNESHNLINVREFWQNLRKGPGVVERKQAWLPRTTRRLRRSFMKRIRAL